MQKRQQIQLVLAFILACVCFIGLSWIWGHSYIYLVNNTSHARTYRFINSSGVATSFRSSDKIVKRVVKNDTYQIVVQQDSKNFFAVRKTQGLLRSISIDVGLVREKSRSFVGNNPSPCAYVIGDAMFSAECDGSAYRIEKHLPASGYTPSYSTQLSSNNLYGELAGMATTRAGDYVALLKDVEGLAGYSLQVINSDLVGAERVRIDALDPNYVYEIRPYGNGVLVYENSRADYFYINPVDMSSVRLRPELPRQNGLSIAGVRTHKDDIIILYSENSTTENLNPENDMTATTELAGTSEVIVYNKQKQKHFILPNIYSSATTCGQGRLCAIGLAGMAVYDISESKPRKLYVIPGVTDMFETSSSNLRIVSSLGVMSYNPLSDSGFYDYTFGDYRPCGFSPAPGDTYLLCLVDIRQDKIGLLIGDGETTETNPIDKIVLNVLRSETVSSVSVYRNLVIITPQYYDSASRKARDEKMVQRDLRSIIDKAAFPKNYVVISSADL
ncbi:hypothetical protein IPL68_02760 [Candidatus Saccharibacteria bacterium]|nr:MAG: hypothetical protein IPL68_02760 [Candidatus Saccharibacteria bacterium]